MFGVVGVFLMAMVGCAFVLVIGFCIAKLFGLL